MRSHCCCLAKLRKGNISVPAERAEFRVNSFDWDKSLCRWAELSLAMALAKVNQAWACFKVGASSIMTSHPKRDHVYHDQPSQT